MLHKATSLQKLTPRQLRGRRARLARQLPDAEMTLRGSLQTQGRRCGKEACCCAEGELHGPYVYLATRSGDRTRMLYIAADVADQVSRRVGLTAELEAALAEISAINLELLARGELN